MFCFLIMGASNMNCVGFVENSTSHDYDLFAFLYGHYYIPVKNLLD